MINNIFVYLYQHFANVSSVSHETECLLQLVGGKHVSGQWFHDATEGK